jgi:hypothetical protein
LRQSATPGLANRFLAGSAAAVALFSLAACAAKGHDLSQINFRPLSANPRIVLMPPDIRYYLLTAGGHPELHAEWTGEAQSVFSNTALDIARAKGVDLVVLGRNDISPLTLQYEGLHAAVGEAVIEHALGSAALPSRDTNLASSWTLGPGVRELSKQSGADYGLFVHYRENQASGGRIAFAILAAAAKTPIPTGSSHGFVSLIDLETGNIAWFGVISGDMREVEGANAVAGWIFDGLPFLKSTAGGHAPE